jgi:hypothetical protein
LKNICSSHFIKAPDSAFTKRFLRENSYFLLSEIFNNLPKSIENQSNSTNPAPEVERTLENCPQSFLNNTPSAN